MNQFKNFEMGVAHLVEILCLTDHLRNLKELTLYNNMFEITFIQRLKNGKSYKHLPYNAILIPSFFLI